MKELLEHLMEEVPFNRNHIKKGYRVYLSSNYLEKCTHYESTFVEKIKDHLDDEAMVMYIKQDSRDAFYSNVTIRYDDGFTLGYVPLHYLKVSPDFIDTLSLRDF